MLCTTNHDIELCLASSSAELARGTVSRRPLAIVLGFEPAAGADLDTIEMIHAIHKTVPVIVVAKADSLDLERRARETRIFYYLVEPLQRDEVDAVIDDLLRLALSK